jgi:hypothetical protein
LEKIAGKQSGVVENIRSKGQARNNITAMIIKNHLIQVALFRIEH